jgi:Na+/melibiose symporter-like transporter
MSHIVQKLSFREKLGYSLGDAATNFFFQTMLMFQNRFYTDTFGISAAAAAWLFLVVRLWDACFDPMVGIASDRTNSRWGKFRPWVLWTALPFGLVFWLTFTTPSFGASTKIIYAWGTYIVLMMLYSANNTPYSALTGVMTEDVDERTSISTYRFFSAMVATLIVQGLTRPLVYKFGHGDDAKGWSITIGIYACICVVFYFIAFASVRERVRPDPKQQTSVKGDIADVFKCRPWVLMFLLTLCIFITLAWRGSSMDYYFNYYVDRAKLIDFLNAVGLGGAAGGQLSWGKTMLNWFGLIVAPDGSNAGGVGFGFFNMTGITLTIVGVLFSKPLSVRFGKKGVFLTGMGAATVVTALIYIVPRDNVTLLFWLSLAWPAAWGPTIPLLWAMIADVADYSEWKTGRRATGFVYAGIVFALKAGLMGGAFTNGVLAAYGYVANVPQTEQALHGIRLSATVFAAIPFAVGLVCLAFYPISKELNLRIGDELAERRKKFAAP